MAEVDWHKCRFLESIENLKPLVKKRFGREPSTSIAREITACLQQGRLFYEAATSSPLEIKPLQLFYGMIGFAKALIVAHRLCSLATLRPAHGLRDVSAGNSRIANLRLRIGDGGNFQDFNDVVAQLTRVCYTDNSTRKLTVSIPSAISAKLVGIELSLQDVLSRIPGLESLYRMTFGEEANTEAMPLETDIHNDTNFCVRVDDPQLFTDRESLRGIVGTWRSRFPFLKLWRLHSAQHGWGNSIILFRNTRPPSDLDEFAESNMVGTDDSLQCTDVLGLEEERFPLAQGLAPVAGGFSGGFVHAIAPVGDSYLSEFSLQYLALFQLGSLLRYRPQTWTHAISRSLLPDEPADDKALSLVERFLDLNRESIPEFVVGVLNPNEDFFG